MKVLFDSDTLFSLYVTNDINHKKSKILFEKLLKNKDALYISNLVLQETATVLSHKIGQKESLDFIKRVRDLPLHQVFVSEKLTAKSWLAFEQQTKKNISFIDCSNLILLKELNINKIFSFDKFYPKRIRLG